jgi:uncharacterized membrane protein
MRGSIPRRLAVLVLVLAIVSAAVAALAETGERLGPFVDEWLAYNLLLAWLPLAFAFVTVRTPGRMALVPAALWLAFLPNAPYVVTDLIHVGNGGGDVASDAVVIGAAAAVGVVLGGLSLALVQARVAAAAGARAGWIFAYGILVLAGVGVYIGRVLRWNSWDAFVRPLEIVSDTAASWAKVLAEPELFSAGLFLAVVLLAGYGMCFRLAERDFAVLSEGVRRRAR